MKFNIEEHLDEQNLRLLSKVRSKLSVKFEQTEKPYFECYLVNEIITIYYNPKIFKNSSFAHELLHGWYYSLDLFGSNLIYLTLIESEKSRIIFDKTLCDHIGYCMAHCKIYPKFLNMGYAPEEFLSSSGLQCDFNHIKVLRTRKNEVYSAINLNFYIGSLISIHADHMPNDYSQHLNLMRAMEPELFDIIEVFWQEWSDVDVDVDVDENDIILRTDFEVIFNFNQNIKNWIEFKPIY